MEFRTAGCNSVLVTGLYKKVFIEEKGWPAEELIKREDGHDFALFHADEVVGGMRVIIKKEARSALMLEKEFYTISDNSGEITIVALEKEFRGWNGLKFLFRELYRFAFEKQIFRYYAIVDPQVYKVFSIFGFKMDNSKGKIVWGEMCYPGFINIKEAMVMLSQRSPKLHGFLRS